MVAKIPGVFSINDRVSHFQYGQGTITEVVQPYMTIEFDENGTRRFLTSLVKLEHSDVAAPEPPAKPVRKKSRSKAKKS